MCNTHEVESRRHFGVNVFNNCEVSVNKFFADVFVSVRYNETIMVTGYFYVELKFYLVVG